MYRVMLVFPSANLKVAYWSENDDTTLLPYYELAYEKYILTDRAQNTTCC